MSTCLNTFEPFRNRSKAFGRHLKAIRDLAIYSEISSTHVESLLKILQHPKAIPENVEALRKHLDCLEAFTNHSKAL